MTESANIALTPQMFAEVQRMAALDERRRIIKTLNEILPTTRLAIANGIVGVFDSTGFIPLEDLLKNGNSNPDSAPASD